VQPAWVIVQTKPTLEHVAERSLLGAGYRTYVPYYRKMLSPHGRERKPASGMRPLFPSLVFVQDWRGWPQVWIGGITGLMLVRPSIPARLSDRDIALVMERERSGAFDELLYPRGAGLEIRTDIEIGEQVEIEAHGARILGTLEELSPDGKAIVEMMLFGRLVRASVDPAQIRKAR
jgi:transcription antitermination factor NusG